MKKIISLFERNYNGNRLVRNEVSPGAEWVTAGEGVATRKFNGTCCLIRGGKLYKRYELKPGATPPANFEPATDEDPVTEKRQGWVPVGDGPDDQWHREAFARGFSWMPVGVAFVMYKNLIDGTYELIGPKIQGNPEGAMVHLLVAHGSEVLSDCPRDFDALRAWLASNDIEGIVWHHPDGRMVKIKMRDFGLLE